MSKAESAITVHRDWFIDFARIVVGMILIVKGIAFLSQMETLMEVTGAQFETFKGYGLAYGTLAHLIIFANILGGVAVMIGFLTRMVIPVQFPVILIALISEPIRQVYFGGTMTEPFMLLLLLTGILVYGSGQISVDYYIRQKKE